MSTDRDWLDAFTRAAAELHPGPEVAEACVCFARRMSELVYGVDAVARAPIALWHLIDRSDPWGPVSAVVAAGLGDGDAVDELVAGRFCRVQGWRGVPFAAGVTGHTFTAYRDVGRSTTRILDAAAGREGDGEGNYLVDWPTFRAEFHGGIRAVALR